MADGRNRAEWGRTSEILAMLANCNRNTRRHPHPFTAEQFSPFRARRETIEKVPIGVLKDVFVRQQRQRKR